VARLIVKLNHLQNVLFTLDKDEIIIGRGSDADLMLPNISVSREHARILYGVQGVNIEDLDSDNGVLVNNQRVVEQQLLLSGDEIQIGRFTMYFISEEHTDRFWRGRAISYFPKYEKKKLDVRDGETHMLSPAVAARLKQDNQLLNNACLTMEGSSLYWYPEGHAFSFGDRRSSIVIDGFFVRGHIATIEWDGRYHKLQRNAAMVGVSLNDQKLGRKEAARLRPGDVITIGKSVFTYDIRV